MNVFWRELKAHRKALFFWTLGAVLLIASGMGKYAASANSGQSLNAIIEQFPKGLMALFGMTGFDLTTAIGFFGVLVFYLQLLAAIHAVLLGAGIIASEEQDKTAEFLFVKPITRTKVITAKLLAALVNILTVNLFSFAISAVMISYYNNGNALENILLPIFFGLLLLQLVFLIIGSLLASILKNPASSGIIGSAVVLICLVIYEVVSVSDNLSWLKILTPFKYFDTNAIINGQNLNLGFVIFSVVLIIIGAITTYWGYGKRDLRG